MAEETLDESFADFKNSFAYGSRPDLNFKFLKGLSDEEAADFLQELLWTVADTIDDGDTDRLADLVVAGQTRSYAGPSTWQYEDGPFVTLSKPLSEMQLALITSSGHFVDGDDPQPFGVVKMSQEEAVVRIDDFLKVEPSLSSIPSDTPESSLRVRHGGYDIRSAQLDPNVAFPLTRLREFAADGVIGELAPNAYSFVGACAQTRLMRRTGPKWVEAWRAEKIDGAILVPV